jgi:hypothetical protein
MVSKFELVGTQQALDATAHYVCIEAVVKIVYGFELREWQKEYLKTGKTNSVPPGRRTGKTFIEMLRLLTKFEMLAEPIEMVQVYTEWFERRSWYVREIKEMRWVLIKCGIPCRTINE